MTDTSVVGTEPAPPAHANLIDPPDQQFQTAARPPISSLYPADDFLPATVIATSPSGTPYLVPVVCERVAGMAIYPEPHLEQPAGATTPTSVRFELEGFWRLQHVETGTELPVRMFDHTAARDAAKRLAADEQHGHVHVRCAHDLRRWTADLCSVTSQDVESTSITPAGRFA
ncbi:hypothetical protein [Actinokineospora enzanensis]|uniref:hypothetical protein n=1 Tax=Actinokineospora enzanensis TaxID=155975 RepID=UPI00037F6454|nr:hypothetical protein [Actinokineospora enzanensis]